MTPKPINIRWIMTGFWLYCNVTYNRQFSMNDKYKS